MTAISSITEATCGKISLTSVPHWPCLANLKGEGYAAPVGRSVANVTGSDCPAYFARAGLGSKVSTCDAPPLAKMWMTCLALAGQCGAALGPSRLAPLETWAPIT